MKVFYILLFAALCTSCAQQQAEEESTASINEGETKAVLDHHWVAFKANDLEETMKDYTDESVLITPNATYRGLEEIRENFVNAFRMFPKDSTTFSLDQSVVVHDVGYIVWKSKTPTFDLVYATDTFIIRGGKIIRQTYAGLAE